MTFAVQVSRAFALMIDTRKARTFRDTCMKGRTEAV